jgi:hypothetical protein
MMGGAHSWTGLGCFRKGMDARCVFDALVLLKLTVYLYLVDSVRDRDSR